MRAVKDQAGSAANESGRAQLILPVPRISVQAFCETPELAALIQEAVGDRRMDKAHVKVHMGGAAAAVEAYQSAPTPNVIAIEAGAERQELLAHLDRLAEFCDSGTKVVVSGRVNDIVLYRDLMARGVSEYLVAPFGVLDFVQTLSHLYTSPGAEPVGRLIAVTGVKGGVGASTIAHNIAWSIGRGLDVATVIVDMDLPFGTAGLDFNQDPPQGIAEAVYSPDRLDANLIDRLLSKCSDKLSILAAPATLDRMYDFSETSFDGIIDILRATVPCIVVDVPHMWTSWTRRMLVGADEVILVAAPDLANLRNAKNILDTLRTARPNDIKPRLVLNGIGVVKRPEISVKDFAKAVELDPIIVIPHDPKLFGTAANNGQMIAEVDANNKIAEMISEVSRLVTGRAEVRKPKKTLLVPLMSRLSRK
jgi:pilus assembly protein CpaE